MKRIKIFALVLSLLLVSQTLIFADEAVLRKVLNNGLTVLAKERSPKDIVTIDVSVKAAPRYEGRYLGTGISHLVEHMLFKGTASRKPGDIEKEMRSYGGLIGGAVSSDFTSYQLTVPSKYFVKALALLKDMLLNAAFDPVELVKERDVILKEVKLNEDDPEKKSILSLFFNSYVRHPYRYPAIGYEDLLKGLSRDDLLEYYKARYVPNNMVIAIAGDINEKDAVSQAEKEFKDFGKPDYSSADKYEQEPVQLGKKMIEDQAPTTLSYIVMGFHSTGILNKDLFEMDVLSMILGRGNNSRLNRSLVEDNRVAHLVSASNYTPEDPGLFIISAVTDSDKIDSARKAILEEVRKIRDENVTDKELETAKNMVLSDYVLSRETVEEDAKDLCENQILTGNYDFSSRYIEGVEKLTKSDIKRAAMRYLTAENMTEVALVPKSSAALPDVRVPKIPSEEKMEKRVFSNGLTLLTRRDNKVGAVALTAAFSGGLLVEDKNNNGISNFLAKTLLDGTKSRKEIDIRGAIENRGGEISSFSGFNSFGINITVLKNDLGPALELLKDVVSDSVFDAGQIVKEKMLAIASIKEEDNDIFQKGIYLLRKSLFAEHPYAMRYTGEMETVSHLKKEDLINFYHAYCVPNNMVISVSGDIDPKEVSQKIEALFKEIPQRELPKRPVITSLPGKIDKETFKMDKEQALLLVGFKTVGVNDPDKYTLDLIDTLLSGMSGRLFASIRDKSGLSYTLGCAQKLGLDTGLMLFYVATTKDNIAASKEKLFNEIKLIRDNPVTDDELNFAKQEAISSYKMTMQTNAAYAFQSAMDTLYGLGYDNLYKYEEHIKNVTKEDIKRVAAKYLDLVAYTEIVIEPE